MPHLATIASFGFEDLPTGEMLVLYRELGCRTSQFYRNPNNMTEPGVARRIAEDAGVPLDSLHGLFGPRLDPSSPDEEMRRSTIETYRREAEVALVIGGPMVVVHPSSPRQPGTWGVDDRPERAEALVRSIHDLARIGDEMSVTFLIENLPPTCTFGDRVDALAQLVREAAELSVRLCFDTGHANINGDPVAAFGARADLVALCHVNDNDGEADTHRFPGDGSCPWHELGPRMATLPESVPLMLELFPEVGALRDRIDGGYGERLRSWFSSPDRNPAKA